MFRFSSIVLTFLFVFTSHALRANENCEIYPLTVSSELLSNATDGARFDKVALGTGPGNYSWLTWDGANDAPSLAQSLIPPGNSELYINPDDANDTSLSIGDFVQGRPGVKNSRDIRDNLDALLDTVITIPVWDSVRGQGSQFDYAVAGFAAIELTGYKLNGKGWISFIYRNDAECANDENSPPVALDLSVSGAQDTQVNISVVATDADDDPLTYSVVTFPSQGTLTGAGPDYIYTPNAGFVGTDSFSFVANDGLVDSNVATATIEVLEVNSPPTAEDLLVEVAENEPVFFTLVATDPDGDPLTYTIINEPNFGVLFADGPDYEYSPLPGFTGTDSFTYVANDGQADSNVATVVITIGSSDNSAPFVEDLVTQTLQNQSVEFTVTAFDPDGDSLTFTVVVPPENGTITGSGPTFTYQPAPDFFGNETIYIIANDGQADSNEAEISIQVFPDE